MILKNRSHFKHPEADKETFQKWVGQLEQSNGYTYEKRTITTSLGATQVYGFQEEPESQETLVIFPGFRTTTLIWDLDQGLQKLAKKYRLFLVETNGQPNLSDGNTPSVRSLEYGEWGTEVFEQLGIERAYIAGASFGGLVCMKISLVIPEKIKAAFLLNPGCFRFVSMSPRNLFYNFLPLVKTTSKNILRFLEAIVFCKPNHQLSQQAEDLLVAYLTLAITRYKDRTDKPYYMGKQLDGVKVNTYLLEGDRDVLIPYQKSIRRARQHLGEYLREVKVFPQVGHGNECHAPTLAYIYEKISALEAKEDQVEEHYH